MDTQQFKYFLQLCIDKNYSVAADKLYITQQALRKSIKRLETETGCTMFYRSGDSLELSRAGACVKSHARNILRELEVMENSLAAMESDRNGNITIAFSYGVYPTLAEKLIIPFNMTHPSLKLKVLELPDASCEDAVKNGDADLGFCIGPNDAQYFDIHEVLVHDVCTMVNRSNPLSKRESLSLDDLRGQKLAIVNGNFKIHQNFINACKQIDFAPDIELDGGDVISVHNFSRFAKNICVTVDFLAEDLAFDESVMVPLVVPGLNWTINMIVSRSEPISKSSREFISYTKEAFR